MKSVKTSVIVMTMFLLTVGICACSPSLSTTDDGVDNAKKAPTISAYIESQITNLESDDQIDRYDPSGLAKESQLQILQRTSENGEMSRNDYETSWSQYKQCMTSRGYKEIILIEYPNGVYVEAPHRGGTASQENAYHQDMLECGTMYTTYVDAVYKTLVGNPNLYEDPYASILDCLRREEIAPKGYDANDLKHDLHDAASPDDLIINIYDPSAASCLVSNGITVTSEDTQVEELW